MEVHKYLSALYIVLSITYNLLYKIFSSTSFSIYYKYYDLLVYISGKRQYLHLQYLIFATFLRGNPHKVEGMHFFYLLQLSNFLMEIIFFKDVKYIPFFYFAH